MQGVSGSVFVFRVKVFSLLLATTYPGLDLPNSLIKEHTLNQSWAASGIYGYIS